MNIPKLRGKITEKGKTHAECASVLGISTTAFSNKMNGTSKFYIDELETLGNFLGMTPSEKYDIFLS